MREIDSSAFSPATFRHAEAEYFLSQYIRHCGPPIDSYFFMVCYFDAFLFSLISIEEMVSKDAKKILKKSAVFLFLKALRNISTHHSVLGAVLDESKFPRPFSRVIDVSTGGPPNDASRLKLRIDVLREIFKEIERERPRDKINLGIAMGYLNALEAKQSDVFLEEIMKQGLREVKALLETASPARHASQSTNAPLS